MNQYGNYCWRCGKERIITKTWKEKVNNSVVTTTETACPDKECQMTVEKTNRKNINKVKASRLKRKLNLSRSRKA